MKFTSAAAVFGLAAVASAQNNNPSAPPAGGPSIPQIGSAISQQCLSSIISIATSPAASCVNLQGLAPLATSNGSIVPVLDKWMTGLCSSQPCSNATLANVTQAIGSGCASDLAKYNVSNSTLNDIISNYPLAREVLCLKTTQPANLTNATIPLTQPPYNLTNGTFCVTSLLTEVSAYTGANLTLNTIYQTAMGGLQAAEQLVSRFPKNFLCQDCVFGAVDIVLRKYPQVANVSLMYNGMSNATVGNVVNGICPSNYTWTTNGTLPSTLRPTAVNSTFQYNLTVGNMTYSPANVSARRSFIDVTAAKRRMIGQI